MQPFYIDLPSCLFLSEETPCLHASQEYPTLTNNLALTRHLPQLPLQFSGQGASPGRLGVFEESLESFD
jgi:hypothetical protein